MAIQYFGTFPTIEYNLEKDETDAKTVVDITKRVGIRSDFSEHIGSYYKTIYAENSSGHEPIALDLNVLCRPPAWDYNPNIYQKI